MLKRRVYDILEVGGPGNRLARIVDSIIVAMVIANVAAVVLGTVQELREQYGHFFQLIEIVTVVCFLIEYVSRMWVADLHPQFRRLTPLKARLAFAAEPTSIIDLLAFLPPLVGVFFGVFDIEFAVAFRLIRFLKLARYSPGMRSLAAAFASERRAIFASALIMLGLVIGAATLMHSLEAHVQPDKFGSIPAAMYWAVTTLTTVGYGDVVPITPAGKILAGITMVVGFTMFALPVGIIATAFAREIRQRDFVVTWSTVARVPLFAELSASEIAAVMRLLRAQSVEAGTVITYADDPASSMYFIVSGRVEIALGDGPVELGEGHFFGEIAVLRRARRSADVIALSACRLLILDAEDLQHLMHKRPEIGRHIRNVAESRLKKGSVTPQGDIAGEELKQAGPKDGDWNV